MVENVIPNKLFEISVAITSSLFFGLLFYIWSSPISLKCVSKLLIRQSCMGEESMVLLY